MTRAEPLDFGTGALRLSEPAIEPTDRGKQEEKRSHGKDDSHDKRIADGQLRVTAEYIERVKAEREPYHYQYGTAEQSDRDHRDLHAENPIDPIQHISSATEDRESSVVDGQE